MNKWVLFFSILLLFLIVFPKQGTSEFAQDDITVIPDESIRLRILANSNTEQDQQIKYEIRDRVNEEITKWVEEMASIDDARQLIQQRISHVQTIAENVIKEAGLTYDVKVAYDKHVTFPRKLYGSYLYPEGEYEAILMTIGEGQGDNWWCVLFPPLCFLDFSFGATVQETDDVVDEEKDLTIKFFLFEWLGWS
ncbi:MAG TPA: stage II sporulation protein R [Bacillota bacterium]|nr:stage II sporulation protein R [Bacillota bacterium]